MFAINGRRKESNNYKVRYKHTESSHAFLKNRLHFVSLENMCC